MDPKSPPFQPVLHRNVKKYKYRVFILTGSAPCWVEPVYSKLKLHKLLWFSLFWLGFCHPQHLELRTVKKHPVVIVIFKRSHLHSADGMTLVGANKQITLKY